MVLKVTQGFPPEVGHIASMRVLSEDREGTDFPCGRTGLRSVEMFPLWPRPLTRALWTSFKKGSTVSSGAASVGRGQSTGTGPGLQDRGQDSGAGRVHVRKKQPRECSHGAGPGCGHLGGKEPGNCAGMGEGKLGCKLPDRPLRLAIARLW